MTGIAKVTPATGRAARPEALRLHRLQVEHTIQAITEQFRQERAADLDDSVIKDCPCGNRFVIPPCPRCTERFPESGNPNGDTP